MANSVRVLIEAVDNASSKFQDIGRSADNMANQFKIAGGAIMAFGAGITTALGFAVRAAADEEAGIARLSQALNNVGQDYYDVSRNLEWYITATQRATGVSDGQLRTALQRLIMTVGDYDRALDLLPLTLDWAAAKQMDVTNSAELIGRVAQGNVGMLSRYGISLREGAGSAAALAAMQEQVSGSAVTMADTVQGSMNILKAEFGDTSEIIGNTFLPVIAAVLDGITSLLVWFNNLSPATQTLIAVIAGLVGVASLLGGAFLMIVGFLPAISGGLAFLGMSFGGLLLPIGLFVAAIAAGITIGYVLAANWDSIASALSRSINAIGDAFRFVFNSMIGTVEDFINMFVGAANAIVDLVNSITNAIAGLFGGGRAFEISSISSVSLPKLQTGGIITRPTIAMVGESGPEAVIPLKHGITGGITINFNAPVYGMADFEAAVARVIKSRALAGGFKGVL